MSDQSINPNTIQHVLAEGNGVHAVYLSNAHVVRWSAVTGQVLSVVKLPSEAAIAEALGRPPKRGESGSVSTSSYTL